MRESHDSSFQMNVISQPSVVISCIMLQGGCIQIQKCMAACEPGIVTIRILEHISGHLRKVDLSQVNNI